MRIIFTIITLVIVIIVLTRNASAATPVMVVSPPVDAVRLVQSVTLGNPGKKCYFYRTIEKSEVECK